MTASRFLLLSLWAAPHCLQVAILILMVRRKIAREFPIFFVYTCFQVLQFVVLFAMDQMDRFTGDQYIVTWLGEEYVSAALRFAVIHEIFHHVFQGYGALQKFGGQVFRWSTVLLMIVAVVLVAYSSGTNLDRVSLVWVVINRAVDIMQVGLLLLLLVLVRQLRLSWSTYAFPMVVGFGIYASIMLVNTALQAHFGTFYNTYLTNQIDHVGYTCTVLVWLSGLLVPKQVVSNIEPQEFSELQDWNAELQRLLQQ